MKTKRVLCLLWIVLTLSGCGEPAKQENQNNNNEVPKVTIQQIDLPSARWSTLPATLPVPALAPTIQRGFCLSHSHRTKGYGSDASSTSKQALQEMGVQWVSLTRFGWMENLTSTTIRYDRYRPFQTEIDLLTKEVNQIRERKMKVVLKPHIWIGGSAWVGDINPSGSSGGWEAWFKSYQAFILKYAVLAETLKVEMFVMGVELKSATGGRRDEWLKIIAAIRKVYSGQLVYASNWDETSQVVFWDKLDAIGIDFYGPLTDQDQPSFQTLVEGANKYIRSYEGIAKKHNIPIIFTEVGYRSTVASFKRPHIWPQNLPEDQRTYDELAQALGYAAFLTAVSQSSHVQGIYWWKWFTDVSTDEEGQIGFSPYKKLASKVLTASFK